MVEIIHKSIPERRYIDSKTEVVSPSKNLRGRELIGRVFGKNELIPFGRVLEFGDVESVREYFGIGDDGEDAGETVFADMYLSFSNASGNSPSKISFSRWSDTHTQAYLIGSINGKSPAEYRLAGSADIVFNFQTKTDSTVKSDFITLDTESITSIAQFAGRKSLVDAINEKFRSKTGVLNGCVASYVQNGRKIKITFGQDVRYVYPCTAVGDEANSVAKLLGLLESDYVICSDAIMPDGSDGIAAGVNAALTESLNISEDFGSFCFYDDGESDVGTVCDIANAATRWMSSRQYDFLYVPRMKYYEDAESGRSPLEFIYTFRERVSRKTGVHAVTGCHELGYNHEEALPMAILASIDYDEGGDASSNWMFQSAPKMVSPVRMDNWASNLDGLLVNYLGKTQEIAGERAFYQKGVNMDGMLSSVYCAEMWIRDRIRTAIVEGFLGVEKVDDGDAETVFGWMRTVFVMALENGMFERQENGISDMAKIQIDRYFGGVDGAWRELEKDGYGCQVTYSRGKVAYKLAYFKHSQVFKLEGTLTIE